MVRTRSGRGVWGEGSSELGLLTALAAQCLVGAMRPVLLLLLAALGLTACETTPKVASPEQPCNCAASRGEAHQPSGRTQISR